MRLEGGGWLKASFTLCVPGCWCCSTGSSGPRESHPPAPSLRSSCQVALCGWLCPPPPWTFKSSVPQPNRPDTSILLFHWRGQLVLSQASLQSCRSGDGLLFWLQPAGGSVQRHGRHMMDTDHILRMCPKELKRRQYTSPHLTLSIGSWNCCEMTWNKTSFTFG